MACDYSQPIQKFRQQARQAKQRGIPWELTFEEWTAIWEESGKWELRGKCAGQYVMARQGDVGPYSRENVFICEAGENHRDAHRNGRVPVKKRAPRVISTRVVRGWTRIGRSAKRPYQVMVSSKYIGSYATQEEAEAAYRAARAVHESSVRQSPDCSLFLS